MSALDAYLDRLGIDDRPPPSIESLREVHRRHVSTVPYENLAIMLGRPPSVDPPESFVRVDETGRSDNPDGRWWVAVGIGDALLAPLPLVEGEHEEAGFRFRIQVQKSEEVHLPGLYDRLWSAHLEREAERS